MYGGTLPTYLTSYWYNLFDANRAAFSLFSQYTGSIDATQHVCPHPFFERPEPTQHSTSRESPLVAQVTSIPCTFECRTTRNGTPESVWQLQHLWLETQPGRPCVGVDISAYRCLYNTHPIYSSEYGARRVDPMEKKRKLPARAAARVEQMAKRRTLTPPERHSETPPPPPEPETAPVAEPPAPLPTAIQAGKPLPTVEEPQLGNLPAKEYQSVSERYAHCQYPVR